MGGMTDTPAAIAAEPALPGSAAHRAAPSANARYASYPAPEHFDGRFGSAQLVAALSTRRVASQTVCSPLAVHVQIPFHDARIQGAHGLESERRRERVASYLDALEREVTLVVEQIGPCRSVSRVHLGGDWPGCLDDAQLARLMGLLRRNFYLERDAEVAIDVDPAGFDARRLPHMRELGFDHVVLKPVEATPEALARLAGLVDAARGLADMRIDVEFAGGFSSAAHTLADVAALRPDRIALPASDRRPGRTVPAREADDLAARAAFGSEALSCLADAGYEAIGPGQFALRADALAVARREGALHLTLQGYRARPDHDVLGLGVAAIGRIGDCLYQNARTLPAYHGALDDDRLPVTHGHVVDADDKIRGDVIQALMARGRVDCADIVARHGVDMRSAFATEITRLAPFAARGLVELHEDRIDLTPAGQQVADDVAAVFDRYLHERATPARSARTAR